MKNTRPKINRPKRAVGTKPDITKLDAEIIDGRRTISADGYPMSIGEITNLYKEGELIIRPEFQRFFRWTEMQKSTLIESIMLGIPIPSIFVAQTDEGKWEIVDGLQRVSTILELQGELLEDGVPKPPLELRGTKYIPSLESFSWENIKEPKRSLSSAQKLDIKRAKIDIKIIKRESSQETKFDLFQRLNSYGSTLTSQEMRSALLVSVSPAFFKWIEKLAADENFKTCTQFSERLIEERYDLEIVIRFLVLHNRPAAALTTTLLRDLSQVLDDGATELAKKFPRSRPTLEKVFKSTFKHLAENGDANIFQRWDAEKEKFQGSFLNTSFEVFGLGVGFQFANDLEPTKRMIEAVRNFWGRPGMTRGFATGRSSADRLVEFIPLGRDLTAAKPIPEGLRMRRRLIPKRP